MAKRAELFAAINENPISRIDVFSGEICGVRLSGTGFVQQLVISAAFWIFFGSDDGSVFFGSDRSFALAADFGPCSFGEDGPREPAEINRQVVKSAEIMRHAISVRMDDPE